MTALLWLAGALFVGGPLLLAAAAFLDVGRRPGGAARRVWQGMLLFSLLTAPVLPGVALPSAERTRIIEGPDLLSGEPIERSAASGHERWGGLRRVRIVRETQGGRLLREERRDVLIVPVLPLLLGAGWFLRGARRGRSRGTPAAAG